MLLTYARHSRYGAKLMYNIARQKIDVIVTELNAGIAYTIASQLIQFSILDPLHTLRYGRLMQIQLQHFH